MIEHSYLQNLKGTSKLSIKTNTCAICGRQRGLDKIHFTLGVGVTISPASSKSECAETMLCNTDNADSPTFEQNYQLEGIRRKAQGYKKLLKDIYC